MGLPAPDRDHVAGCERPVYGRPVCERRQTQPLDIAARLVGRLLVPPSRADLKQHGTVAQLTVAHGLQRAAGWRAAPPTGARGVGAGLAGTARPRNSIIFGGSSPARGPCRGGSNLPAGRVGGVDGRPEKATRLRLFTPLSIILTQAFSRWSRTGCRSPPRSSSCGGCSVWLPLRAAIPSYASRFWRSGFAESEFSKG